VRGADLGEGGFDVFGGDGVGGLAGEAERMARSVAWPMPVRAREPYRSTCTRAVWAKAAEACSSLTKRSAARIGPTVWELEGPMPILKSSKRLVFT